MTTPIVPSISDEQLAELEDQSLRTRQDSDYTHISYGELRGLIARLRAAEADAKRWKCVRNAIQMKSPYAVWHERTRLVLGRHADAEIDSFMAAMERTP